MIEDSALPHVFERIGMAPEHLCRPPSQGRIDVNRYARQPARIDQAGNIEQQLLRALEREYRNDEVPARRDGLPDLPRSEEHTSELQSLMRISYAVFCLKKQTKLPYTNKQITKDDR